MLRKYASALLAVSVIILSSASAQDAPAMSEGQAWEIYTGPFGTQSFYVVKHNRLTGKTLVLNCKGTTGVKCQQWEDLPVVERK